MCMKPFLCLLIFCSLTNNALGTSSDSRHSEYDEFDNTSSEYSISEYARKRSSFMEQFRVNTIRISAIAGTSVTLTCSIDLDDVMFSKSENYKIIKLLKYFLRYILLKYNSNLLVTFSLSFS